MEDLNTIFGGKAITESSKNLYIKNLVRLNDGEMPKNLRFLSNINKIMDKLQKYKPNTQRSYIISIVSLFKQLAPQKKKYEKLYEAYYEILDKMNKELKDQTKKTDKEKEEWISDGEIKSKFKECYAIIPMIEKKRKISEAEYNALLRLVIVALFVVQTPRRNKDYQDMAIVRTFNYNIPDAEDMNFYDVKGNRFIYNSYKTKGKYSTQTNDVEPLMGEILKVYLKFHPLKAQIRKGEPVPFLVDFNGKRLSSVNAITRVLYKAFGQKIGSSMLRKLYLTNKYGSMMKELKEDAADMGTSTATIQNNYIKDEE